MNNRCLLIYSIPVHGKINTYDWFETKNDLLEFVDKMEKKYKTFCVISATKIIESEDIKEAYKVN